MLLLLFLLSVSSEMCFSQYVYNGVLPYDPRYATFRRPVRRSAMEALERLRLPVARYFPQVDTQVAPAPYGSYQWTTSDLYALPPQWTEDFVQQLPENEDYGNYEYESAGPVYRPSAYGDEVYAQEPENGNNLYNDLVDGYFVDVPEERPEEMFDGIQRRSDQDGVVPLSKVLEANENSTTSTPATAMLSQDPLPVQMTAVPASPEKKNVKSLVVPDVLPTITEDNSWREEGQKEEPLFRPLQNSQRTTWSTLNRAKNTPQQKSPIPLLKQMIQSGGGQRDDPLLEELQNLKKKA